MASSDQVAVSPTNTQLGWIGTRVKGKSMCGHLIKAQTLIDSGVKWASSPRDLTSQSDVVFSIVNYPSDVRQVLLDPSTGALSRLSPGGVLVDMTTSKPSLAVEIAVSCDSKSCFSIDAPVFDGDRGAKKNAAFSIFAGFNSKQICDNQRPGNEQMPLPVAALAFPTPRSPASHYWSEKTLKNNG